MPDNLRFGGGVSSSIINPFVALVVLVAGILICVWPRNKAVLPFIFASILVPTDQVLLIGGLHFPMMRVLILFGLFRIFRTKATSRSQIVSGGMNKIDIAVVLLAVSSAVAGVALWQQSAVVTYQLGELFSTFGTYFILRFFIRDREDVLRVIRSFAYITLFVAAVMLIEQWRGWNPYALLGGARAEFFASSMQRDDRFRATGCFAHPILAGTFGAIMVPLFIGMWFVDRKQRRLAVAGGFASMLMILASNSSTPITGLGAGMLALSLWPFRDYMSFFRRGVVITLVMLHMVMKAPVWHLISRIDLSGGSSSYHRYALINETIIHFWEWWLVGTRSNADWGWD